MKVDDSKMQHQALSFSLPLLSIVFSLLSIVSAMNPVIYAQCSQLYFTSNQSYEVNLNSLFTTLVDSASSRNFNTFKISPPGSLPNNVSYGLFQCRGDLSNPDCRECVANFVSQLKTTCPVSIGGSIQSQGCLVKYNNTSTFGSSEDKLEVFKSCGPSIGYNSDVMNHIDNALAYLIVSNGQYFRTGGSGSVLGMVQCVEDFSLGECDNCIVEARARLRSECETSTWGDMYLEICYIRYADHHDGVDDDPYNDSHNNNGDHEGTNSNYILKVAGVILIALLSSGGVSYYISFSLTKNVDKRINVKVENKVNEKAKETKGFVEEAKEASKRAEGARKATQKLACMLINN